MYQRRLEEEQRAMEARREQQLEVERLRRQSMELTSHALRCHPLSCLSRPSTRVHQDLLLPRSGALLMSITSVAYSHRTHR